MSPNPAEWNTDDVLFVLSRAVPDSPGNLVLGESSYRRWQQWKLAPPDPVPETDLGAHYVERAREVVGGAAPQSTAAGEFPKFTALRAEAGITPHVIVKFSGGMDSATERRWADLLVCEHLALEVVQTLTGVASARTRIVQSGGRTFLEGERFDRVGLAGRLPMCSLGTINHAFLGLDSTDWPRLATRLVELGLIDTPTASAIERLWWFGRLIANTDMHPWNLSFFPAPKLQLAPAYDMLPMAYAPLRGGEVAVPEFAAPLPLPQQRTVWKESWRAARAFWQAAARDPRISTPFREICATNSERLDAAAAGA